MTLAAVGCFGTPEDAQSADDDVVGTEATLTSAELAGRETWIKATFGGEKFFSLLVQQPPIGVQVGFDVLLKSSRNTRFNTYGVINDPDCVQGDASSDYFDKCPDDAQMTSYDGASAGVVGFRKRKNPTYTPTNGQPKVLLGIACAGCAAGLDPERPAADPNHPSWSNIHLTVGNQYLALGEVFRAHLSTHDVRYHVLGSWARGTVDTTSAETDNINNPGVITPIFNLDQRPFFNLTSNNLPIRVHRSGQGGEDDAGCEAAALRVYFNIGMCARECMLSHLQNGPFFTQTPINQAQCAAVCPDFVKAKAAVANVCAFMATGRQPSLMAAPGGSAFVTTNAAVLSRGQQVFAANCASCHGGPVLSDDLIHTSLEIGTNSCRSKTTNWMAGHIWAEFSSDQYKRRFGGGPGFYRDIPLQGLWATAPFLHNNRLGKYNGNPSVAGRIAAYEDAMQQLLNPFMRNYGASVLVTSDWATQPTALGVLRFPAGTPIATFNVDPNNPLVNLCPETIENQGHTFGFLLSSSDKRALTEWLKTR